MFGPGVSSITKLVQAKAAVFDGTWMSLREVCWRRLAEGFLKMIVDARHWHSHWAMPCRTRAARLAAQHVAQADVSLLPYAIVS
jgi:hypothetical protein